MIKQSLVLASLLWMACVGSVAAADWAAYESEHFTVYSDARESEVRKLLENFEVFRQVTFATLNLPAGRAQDRLVVVMFDRARDYYRLKPPGNVAGYFYHSIFGPRAVVGPRGSIESTQPVLFHEYVHFLMHRNSAINYPRWYSEGLASMLSSAEIDANSIVIGKPPMNYGSAFSVGMGSTVAQVIDVEYDGTASGFYLTSWLMTHYFLIEPGNGSTRRPQTIDYLRRFDAGENPVDAFEVSYGTTPQQIQFELANYLRKRVWTGISLPRPANLERVSRRVLDESEALFRLGDMAVERDQFEAAHEYFDSFDALDMDSEFQANAMSRRAIAYMHESKIEEGDALIEAPIVANSTDADVLADIAHYSYDKFVDERDDDRESAIRQLQRSIEYGSRAVDRNPTDLEALYYLGLANEADGDLQRAADMLLMGLAIDAAVPRLNSALARVLLKGGQPQAASFLISRLYSASHSEEGRARLRGILRQIEDGTLDLDELEQLL